MIFNLFLPAIKILSKLLRSLNTTLRISSNLTARHLLLLLLFSATKMASSISVLLARILTLFTSIILTIEAAIARMQECIYTSLCLYYSHINN